MPPAANFFEKKFDKKLSFAHFLLILPEDGVLLMAIPAIVILSEKSYLAVHTPYRPCAAAVAAADESKKSRFVSPLADDIIR